MKRTWPEIYSEIKLKYEAQNLYDYREFQEEVSNALADAIKKGIVTNLYTFNWKGTFDTNQYAILKIVNEFPSPDHKKQILEAIFYDWVPRGDDSKKAYRDCSPELIFINWIQEQIARIEHIIDFSKRQDSSNDVATQQTVNSTQETNNNNTVQPNTEGVESWLPIDYFSDGNRPNNNMENWIRGIRDEFSRGYLYKNEGPNKELNTNEKGDPRRNLIDIIENLASTGDIDDDNNTKARLAYVLTGRSIGKPITEEKPITWKAQPPKKLFYILKYLFSNKEKYKQAFNVIDGIGEYPDKKKKGVSNLEELEQTKKDEETMGNLMNPSSLADSITKNEDNGFRDLLHSIFESCPKTKPPKGKGMYTINRQ